MKEIFVVYNPKNQGLEVVAQDETSAIEVATKQWPIAFNQELTQVFRVECRIGKLKDIEAFYKINRHWKGD